MKFSIILIIFLGGCIHKFQGQQQLIFNDNMLMVINEGQVVVENSDTNAIQKFGMGGGVISEAENHILNWKIGNEVGNYLVPFVSFDLVEIPLEVSVKTAGLGGGGITFSTYATTESNTPLPTGVLAPLNCLQEENTNAVVDRFWSIEAGGYSENPDMELNISYDEINDIGGSNVIKEENLKAMYYNTDLQKWENTDTFLGQADAIHNKVKAIEMLSENHHKTWLLVDSTSLISKWCTNKLIIPEAFTPNGDQINESFQILGLHNYIGHRLTIYSRWGSQVFDSSNYDGLWTGTDEKGELIPAGVYFYTLELTQENGSQETVKGSVFIQY